MPLSAAQRQEGDADLARRRATRYLIDRVNGHARQVNDLLDGLETLADALTLAREREADLQNGQLDLFRVCNQLTEERNALRAELAAHRCRAGLAED